LEGLKVSYGMHNFGEKRWGSGLLVRNLSDLALELLTDDDVFLLQDDLRSVQDQNTRIIGDFTKMVRVRLIVQLMAKLISSDSDWVYHFNKVVSDPSIRGVFAIDPVVPKLLSACSWLAENAINFQRQTLQTRFFEASSRFRS
jgi:hypothetical protein